jgi:Bacteriophage CII protein.
MERLLNKSDERSRKIESMILQRLAEKTQTTIAIELGVSESKISRLKNDDIPMISKLITCLGLKVVPDDSLEVSQAELKSIKTLARKYLEIDEMA